MRKDKIGMIAEAIDHFMVERLKHEKNQIGSGNEYADLARQDLRKDLTFTKKLAGFMLRNGLETQGVSIDAIAEMVLENFKVIEGTVWDLSHAKDNIFVASSFPFGNLEVALEKDHFDPDATLREWEAAKQRCSTIVYGNVGVIASDTTWFVVMNAKEISEGISKLFQELKDDEICLSSLY